MNSIFEYFFEYKNQLKVTADPLLFNDRCPNYPLCAVDGQKGFAYLSIGRLPSSLLDRRCLLLGGKRREVQRRREGRGGGESESREAQRVQWIVEVGLQGNV